MNTKTETRAIVIGGSIAGLLAARVLLEHVDQVIVLEKDALPDEPAPRRGVPQSAQLHSIHQKGAEIIQALFPDLAWDYESCGVVPCDLGSEMRWLFFGEWMPQIPKRGRPYRQQSVDDHHRRGSALPPGRGTAALVAIGDPELPGPGL